MTYNFRGKLDEKNRLTLPPSVRSEFSDGVAVITPGFDQTIHLYPRKIWTGEMEKALRVNPNTDDRTPTVLNQQLASQADFFYSQLQEVTIDAKRGRATLDAELLEFSGLDRDKDWKAVRIPTDTGSYWRIRRAKVKPKL